MRSGLSSGLSLFFDFDMSIRVTLKHCDLTATGLTCGSALIGEAGPAVPAVSISLSLATEVLS